jgi:hypothetical protein
VPRAEQSWFGQYATDMRTRFSLEPLRRRLRGLRGSKAFQVGSITSLLLILLLVYYGMRGSKAFQVASITLDSVNHALLPIIICLALPLLSSSQLNSPLLRSFP